MLRLQGVLGHPGLHHTTLNAGAMAHGVRMTPMRLVVVPLRHRQQYGPKLLDTMVDRNMSIIYSHEDVQDMVRFYVGYCRFSVHLKK
jgi:hypothetical protein